MRRITSGGYCFRRYADGPTVQMIIAPSPRLVVAPAVGLQITVERSRGKVPPRTGCRCAGDRIQGRSEIADIYEKTGRSGTMLFIVHRMNFYNQQDTHLATVDWRLVQREFD